MATGGALPSCAAKASGIIFPYFYFKSGRAGAWFWSPKEDHLSPYNIGRRLMATTWDMRPLSHPKGNSPPYIAHTKGDSRPGAIDKALAMTELVKPIVAKCETRSRPRASARLKR